MTRETGWGLTVVEQLTRSWGVLPRMGDGVVVWAVLDVEVPTSRALPSQSTTHI